MFSCKFRLLIFWYNKSITKAQCVSVVDIKSPFWFLDGIVKYMKTQVGPSSKELQTVEDAEKFLKDEVVVVGKFKFYVFKCFQTNFITDN